ncbi:transcriptional regulator [Longispora fulva]|uniref:Putative DNA-binding transcriptional regulator YafY n=1 Tax=Longispora fulva TaxID=619741 RepID=A0A8J7GKN9_9ACTN|nr:YafY family protein [Longispora fulva]MBG6139420.1 putative DNA-binding transcriptional regulator YafY [Longispora fulva]GIG58919.1 transcriptional regulator [Longispora fulva]
MSASQVLAFLELLQGRPGLGGAALAEQLGVDPRTIRRYADQLRDLGIPVEAARGRYGGYRLRPGYKLPPLMFTDAEATAVVVGLLASRQLGLAVGDADGALGKVRRVLPVALRDRTLAVADTLAFTLPALSGEPPDAAVLLTVATAARDHRRVTLRYVSWRGEETDRELDPYGMVFHAGRWYVAGLDHRSSEVRTFRIDRVLSARLAAESFAGPVDFDPVAHVTDSLAKVPYRHPVEVVLETDLDSARRRISPTLGTLVEVPDGVLFTTRAERLDGMAVMLAGLGWGFTIRVPDGLRVAVAELATRLGENARR